MIAFDLKAMKFANDEYLACLFIKQEDAGRYGDLKKSIINNGLRGSLSYPNDLEAAAALLKGYQPTTTEKQSQHRIAAETNNGDIAFTQAWTEVGASPRVDYRACYGCGDPGHLLRDCPKTKAESKGALFKKGDGKWGSSRSSRTATDQTPLKQTAAKKKKAAAKMDKSLVNVSAEDDDASQLSQTSFAQIQRYEALLTANAEEGLEDISFFLRRHGHRRR